MKSTLSIYLILFLIIVSGCCQVDSTCNFNMGDGLSSTDVENVSAVKVDDMAGEQDDDSLEGIWEATIDHTKQLTLELKDGRMTGELVDPTNDTYNDGNVTLINGVYEFTDDNTIVTDFSAWNVGTDTVSEMSTKLVLKRPKDDIDRFSIRFDTNDNDTKVFDQAGGESDDFELVELVSMDTTDIHPYDMDGDGVVDDIDEFDDDPNEWKDTDKDGVGDNSDVFPENAAETKDTDNDGIGDNADIDPLDPNIGDIEPENPTDPEISDGNDNGDSGGCFIISLFS